VRSIGIGEVITTFPMLFWAGSKKSAPRRPDPRLPGAIFPCRLFLLLFSTFRMTIPELLEAYQRNFLPDRADGVDGIIQLHLSGEDGGDYHLIVKDQQLTIQPGLHDQPTVTLSSTASDWIDISLGTANPMMLMMTGRLKISGSLPMAGREA
jgi:putative sterol carrier protein